VTLSALVWILVVGGLTLAAVDLIGAFADRRRSPHWWLYLLRGRVTHNVYRTQIDRVVRRII
jgi:hypothetical protein